MGVGIVIILRTCGCDVKDERFCRVLSRLHTGASDVNTRYKAVSDLRTSHRGVSDVTTLHRCVSEVTTLLLLMS